MNHELIAHLYFIMIIFDFHMLTENSWFLGIISELILVQQLVRKWSTNVAHEYYYLFNVRYNFLIQNRVS